MDYLELDIKFEPRDPWSEIITVELADLGFDSFVETEEGVLAYGPVNTVEMDLVKTKTLLSKETSDFKVTFSEKVIPHQNWNAVWESDFHPVEVKDYLTIVAPFHSKENRKGMLVEIQPQMSFGTGHHQTTWLMSSALFELDSMPAKVLDMGTGTGVLAIIAENLGAKEIVAIDIEDWSVENAKENAERNNCQKINVYCGDVDLIQNQKFGLIIANINKNVLKSHMKAYSESLEKGGTLLLSGFFESDVDELIEFAEPFELNKESIVSKETWAGIKLIKQ
ncbi:MAG: 50S ribosomal protein L11 methyltransferase [Flavobacteriia bacterium]|nr:50S ribosomal protein L11 methyltransferase [Flavobacteriia bacterium]